MKKRNLESFQESALALVLSEGRTYPCPKATRRRRVWAQQVVLSRAEPSRRNHGSVLRSHAHRVCGLLKNDDARAEVYGEAGRVGGEHGTGKGKQSGPDLSGPVFVKKYRRFAPGPPRGPTSEMSAAAAMIKMEVLRDGKLVVSMVVRNGKLSMRNKECDQTVGQFALLRQGSGVNRCALRRLPPREVMASKTKKSG